VAVTKKLYTLLSVTSTRRTETETETELVSVVIFGGLQCADQLCTLLMKMPPDIKLTWPAMSKSESEVNVLEKFSIVL
jgi:hypothetical protein